jgi:hypothetical protein
LEVEKRRIEFELQSEQQSKRRLEKEYQQIQKALQTERESRLFTQAAKARSDEQLQAIKRNYEAERDSSTIKSNTRSSLDVQEALRDVESAKLKVGETLQMLKSQFRKSPLKSSPEITLDELHASQGLSNVEQGLAEAEAMMNRAKQSTRTDMFGSMTRSPAEDLHAAQAKVNELLQLLQHKPTSM